MRKRNFLFWIYLFFTTALIFPDPILAQYNPKASQVQTNTANFNGICDSSDNTVQKCLDKIDDFVGGGSGDITQVWSATSGDVSALTAASGDTMDAGSADSAKPCKRGSALPGTCAEGDCFQDTDSGGSEVYFCTATNTWSKIELTSHDHNATYVLRADWTTIDNYPSACGANQFVTGLADALTCAQPSFSNLSGSATDAQIPDSITLTNITQITTRSHTSLSDIGTNTHAQIDSHISGTSGVHGASGTIVGTSDSQTLTNKTFDGDNNDLKIRRHATDCTALTDGVDGEPCYEKDSDDWFVCEPTSGACDTAAEWRKVGSSSYVLRGDWTTIDNYPSACGANQFVTSLGDTLTCSQPDHGSLGGLSDDDHSQYALLAGRSGGQVLKGGTGAGDDMTLQTTSNASKGSYIFSEFSSAGFLKNDSSGVVTGGNSIADADVPDTITASNYLPLAAGASFPLTAQLYLDNLGIEFDESDTNPSCAAGNYSLYVDLSEGKFKKCVNGSASDLDTTGGTPSFDTLTGGTNSAAAMVVGTGASLGVSGSGTITATTLAANGANASSGNAILGVDASGAAEGAFDVWTESENTAAGYTKGGTLTDEKVCTYESTGTVIDCNEAETGTGSIVRATSPALVTPALGTIASGVGTALTALDGEQIQDDTIDDDSIDFADVTGADLTLTDSVAVTTSGKIISNANLDIKNGATSSGVLGIFEDSDDGTNKATFQVPALSADTNYTLPPDDGDAGEQLQTNGSGVLTWEAAGSGTGAFSDAGDPIVQNTTSKDVQIGDGAGTLAGKLEIGGDDDQPQLVVEGHSTQTDSLAIFQNDADAEQVTIDADGKVYVLNGLDAIGAVDMDYGSADVTDHTFITDGTGDGEIVLPAQSITGTEITNDSVTPTQIDETADYSYATLSGKIDRNNTSVDDDDCTGEQGKYWYDTTDSAFEFCNANSGAPATLGGGGSDTHPSKTWDIPIYAMAPLEVSNAIPPLYMDAGTNIDQLPAAFDDSADECRTSYIEMPTNLGSGNATFNVWWYSLSATTGNVEWYVSSHGGTSEGADVDATLTARESGADAVQGTTGRSTKTSWTVSIATLGWAAGELVPVVLCRDGNDGTNDTMTGDAYGQLLHIEVPRAP